MLSLNTTTLEAQQLSLEELKSVCETVPFMTEKRLVIVKGLLERYESKGKGAGQKKDSKATSKQNEYEQLVGFLSSVPDSTILILIDNTRIKINNTLLNDLSGKAEIRSFPLLKGKRLVQWIDRYVSSRGSGISAQASTLIAELVGSNLRIITSEIDKLVMFTSGKRIEESDVKAVVSYAQEANVFEMVDAILELKTGPAEKLLHGMMQSGAAPAFLLFMLCRQVRLMLQVKEMLNRRSSEAEIRRKLGLNAEFLWRRVLEQSSRHTIEKLKNVYFKLLDTDVAIKTGRYEGELALNLLIAELGAQSRA